MRKIWVSLAALFVAAGLVAFAAPAAFAAEALVNTGSPPRRSHRTSRTSLRWRWTRCTLK
jgi:hypothetical protein